MLVKNINALLQNMIEGMILQDSSGTIIQYNQAALDILGLSKDQLMGQDVIDLSRQDKVFPGKDHAGMIALITGEIKKDLILNIFRRDGEMRWISLNAVPLFGDDTHKPEQLICTFTDITAMKKALNELKQVELLFKISHDMMFITNFEGTFKKVNPRFSQVLGYLFTEVSSSQFINFVHADDVDSTKLELKKLLDLKKTTHFINRYKTKNGDFRVFDWVVVIDSETNLFYFTARDITDYKAEELDLIHSSKVYSIGEMTSCIAYVIHGQLAIISGHVDFIQDQIEKGVIEPKELKNKIQSIEESIQRLAKTTKELTSFARETDNEQTANMTIQKILENVLGLCRERFRIHGVKLNIQIEDNLMIKCRESQMAHVFITLLNNAYNDIHNQRDSWVDFSAKSEDDKVKIVISSSAKSFSETARKLMNIPRSLVEENFGQFRIEDTGPFAKIGIEFPLIKKNIEADL